MSARSYLYVPGDQPALLAKATERGADALILDLEDGVSLDRKTEARQTVEDWLCSCDPLTTLPEIWLRVNTQADLMAADLAVLKGLDTLTGVVIPKTESLAQLERIDEITRPTLKFQPLVETARGLLALEQLAAGPRVERLQLGEADLVADLGINPDKGDQYLDPVRLQVVIVAAAAGLAPPVAPVSTNFQDLDLFEQSTMHLAGMGFGSRAVIHPAQVRIVNRVFSPSPDEVEKARRILQASEGAAARNHGVFTDDAGKMADEAVLRWARAVVSKADRSHANMAMKPDE